MRSGWERTLDVQLKRAKVAYSYETLTLPFAMYHTYRPDFVLKNGVVIEAKGVLNRYDKNEAAKLIAARDQHPEVDLRLVFMDAEKKVTGTKMTHAKWADKYGFQWASGSIPKEWLSES